MATLCVHAMLTLETRQKDVGRAGHALESRWVCAHGALCVRYTSVDEHTTHVQRVLRVCPACVSRWSSALCAWLASFWRVHSCVELIAQFFACTQIPTHTTNDDECTALVQRARHTSNDGDALAKIATFSVRGPCVVPC